MSTKSMNPEIAARVVAGLIGCSVAEGRRIISEGRVSSQSEFAAVIIESHPSISPESLTDALKRAFPGANIGPRHGPHYLSLARTGKLAAHA